MQKQKECKTITTAYTATISDCGYTLICDSATGFEVTLPTVSNAGMGNYNLQIQNIGAGSIVCGGQTISQYSHAHVSNNGLSSWAVSIGGGGGSVEETDPIYTASASSGVVKTAYDHSQSAHAPSNAQKNSDITKAEIEAKLIGAITTHTHAGEVPTGGTVSQVLKKSSNLDYEMSWGDSDAATNGIPAGGLTNQILAKNSDTNYDGKWVDSPEAENGIPSGGDSGQILSKIDSTDYNAQWINPPTGGGSTIWGGM